MAMSNSHYFESDFCLLLASLVLEEEAAKGSNYFVASPLSYHAMLSWVAAGSGGLTLQQLLFFLRSKDVSDLTLSSSRIVSLKSSLHKGAKNLSSGPLLSFVNGAWVHRFFDLKPSFKTIVKESYEAKNRTVDFVKKVYLFSISITSYLFNFSSSLRFI